MARLKSKGRFFFVLNLQKSEGTNSASKHVEASGERTLGVTGPVPLHYDLKIDTRGTPTPAFVHRTLLHVTSKRLHLKIVTEEFFLDFIPWVQRAKESWNSPVGGVFPRFYCLGCNDTLK